MVRVVHVINRLTHGGAERQLTEIVRRSSVESHVIELDGETRDAPQKVLARLRRRLTTADPDVVVAWLDRSQLAVATVARSGLPLVANVRGFPRQRGFHRSIIVRVAFKRFRVIVANSHASMNATSAAYRLGDRRKVVIPNGVSTVVAGWRPNCTSDMSRSPRFAFIGRDDPAKGLDLLLDAVEMTKGVEIVLIGAGVPEKAQARLGRRPGVTSFPRTPDPWSLVGDIDALVVPSRSEGSPNVVLEAFARRVPVIASAVGGTRELLAQERGTLVPPGDSRALAEALAAFSASSHVTRERAQRSLEYVKEVHDWGKVVGAYDALVRDIVGGMS